MREPPEASLGPLGQRAVQSQTMMTPWGLTPGRTDSLGTATGWDPGWRQMTACETQNTRGHPGSARDEKVLEEAALTCGQRHHNPPGAQKDAAREGRSDQRGTEGHGAPSSCPIWEPGTTWSL